jgi:uncharacterized protein YegP (UPF0339 family)
MSGVFEVYKDQKGEYRFRLKAPNGQIILQSEGYTSKAASMNGVESVKENAPKAERFETSIDKGGKHRFKLLAANRQTIGTSEGYESETNMRGGIESVSRWAPKAQVKEV